LVAVEAEKATEVATTNLSSSLWRGTTTGSP
jgi:hypothetical protein